MKVTEYNLKFINMVYVCYKIQKKTKMLIVASNNNLKSGFYSTL
jgi:hypothetical protein